MNSTPTYRYLLTDLRTDQLLAVLPLTGVSFDRRISRVGALGGSLVAPTPQLVNAGKTLFDNAGRSALWVIRNNELWWGGIPWTVQAKQGVRGPVTLDVQAATFDSYAHRRRLYADLTYAGVDQGVIIPDLWRTIQAEDGGNIGMVAEDQPTGVLRDRTYRVSDHAMAGALIEDLGNVIDGPEHTIDVYLDGNGNRVKRLRVANRLGIGEPRAVFQRAAKGGGRVNDWSHTADAVGAGTAFQTRGDAPNGNVGEEVEPLLSGLQFDWDRINAGWPLLDVVADFSGVSDVDTLDGYTQAMAAQQAGAAVTNGYTVEVGNTGWSPNRIGDPVRIKLRDMWHTTNTDLTVRPVGCQVTVPEGEQPEQVTLLLGDGED